MRQNPYTPPKDSLEENPKFLASSQKAQSAGFIWWAIGASAGLLTAWGVVDFVDTDHERSVFVRRQLLWMSFLLISFFGVGQAFLWKMLFWVEVKRSQGARLLSGYVCMLLVVTSLEWAHDLTVATGIHKSHLLEALAIFSVVLSVLIEICWVTVTRRHQDNGL